MPKRLAILIAMCWTLAGCDNRPLQDQVNALLMQYYPSTAFESYPNSPLSLLLARNQKWGYYTVITESPVDAKVCKFHESYRGCIVMRPQVTKPNPAPEPMIYLISPDGAVWTTPDTPDIPQSSGWSSRSRRDDGTIVTMVIGSRTKSIIDYFRARKDKWTQYGTLTRNGDEIRQKLAETGKTLIENSPVWHSTRARDRYESTGLEPGVNC